MTYDDFIKTKVKRVLPQGFEPMPILAPLFPWQKHVTEWAIRQGRAALFEDCGLGKTLQQLEWARQVAEHTGQPVIILTPLAVASQTLAEACKFGIEARIVRQPEDVESGINITNYEKLDLFDGIEFAGVVLDESSILKNFTGKTRIALTERFSQTPFRLCCTATPAPNDFMEFGQHSDFLGVMPSNEMLSRFFINDTMNFGTYRLKGHARNDFWRWVATWAACIGTPSDIGFPDDGYILPELRMATHVVDVDEVAGAENELFRAPTISATTMHKEMRLTAEARAKRCAELVNGSNESWIVWCNTNYEADEIAIAIPDSAEIRGSDRPEHKERMIADFVSGKIRVLVSKPSICGFGLNWQHCRNLVFVGLSYSFEDFYQALRRSYRFGQTKKVNAHIIQARTEGAILSVIQRKIQQHDEMQAEMKIAARAFRNERDKELNMKIEIASETGDGWTLYNGDCVRVAKTLPDNSIDMSVYSQPFAQLYIYSDDVQDMGNCKNDEEFFKQYRFLIAEKLRIHKAGSISAVHCKNLVTYASTHGTAGIKDFRGDIIRAHVEAGWIYHSETTIWKCPVIEMQRTKAHGLLYKNLRADSRGNRMGMAEYIIFFRKWGDGMKDNPVNHTKESFPLDRWQEWASPVWMDIQQTDVLNKTLAKEDADEKHICPLQLPIIERCVAMYSNPGDLVYSPFAGIASEGYQALRMDRRFIGSELKESYFKQACQFLSSAKAQLNLFAA